MDEIGKILAEQGKRFDTMKVLIVDRDEITARYAARAFRRLGISYDFAKNVKFAVRMMEEAAVNGAGYDICLFNCNTDRPDVDDVLFRMRSGTSFERPVVACSFRHGSDCKRVIEDIGGDYYIEQPILQSNLYRMMTEIRNGILFAEKNFAE